jgi:hypothetical protein
MSAARSVPAAPSAQPGAGGPCWHSGLHYTFASLAFVALLGAFLAQILATIAHRQEVPR